jgi:AraC-like DNA-binding protein
MLFYFLQPWQEKYNSFVWAYHPELAYADYKKIIPLDPLYLRAYVNELTFLQFISYAIAAFVVVKNEFKKSGLPVWGKATGKLNEIRIILINIFVVIFIFGFVKVVIGRDLGDNFIAAYIAFIIYMLSFNVIRRSLYFKTSITNDDDNKLKYQKSSLSEEYKQAILSKILKLFETEKYYLDSLVSLPSLSKKIGEAQHHVSQVINELLNQSFFEMIAFYRIEEAKKILKSPQHQNLTIEELAEIVGYNSKSAFNKAFKKHTGLTPSQFRDTISE